MPDRARPLARRAVLARPALARSVAVAAVLVLLAGCGGSSSSTSAGAGTSALATTSAAASPSAIASAHVAVAVPPRIVAVTAGGALVVLNPATGRIASTLVPAAVAGDEISVSRDGMIYFAVRSGCHDEIESVPSTGGSPVMITPGSLPAISPDGTKIAYASQPSLAVGCVPSNADLTALYKMVVRTLGTGAEVAYQAVPAGQGSGLPLPISHLSWSADNQHVAVSLAQVQDNEGYGLTLVDTAAAKYYVSGAGVTRVPVTGQPTPRDSYLREGVYLPGGDLFVSRACCTGFPPRNTSRLMWEVSPSGALVHQVAVGYATLEHTSLAATGSSRWLLYLAGQDLYVSRGGATPRKLATGLIAAAWR
jgi:WD40-like Beta Propeller Repeat